MTASSASVDQNPWRPGVGDADPVADRESDAVGALIPLRVTLSLQGSVVVVAVAATAVASAAPEVRTLHASRDSQSFPVCAIMSLILGGFTEIKYPSRSCLYIDH